MHKENGKEPPNDANYLVNKEIYAWHVTLELKPTGENSHGPVTQQD